MGDLQRSAKKLQRVENLGVNKEQKMLYLMAIDFVRQVGTDRSIPTQSVIYWRAGGILGLTAYCPAKQLAFLRAFGDGT